jgi:hypothetical protein
MSIKHIRVEIALFGLDLKTTEEFESLLDDIEICARRAHPSLRLERSDVELELIETAGTLEE